MRCAVNLEASSREIPTAPSELTGPLPRRLRMRPNGIQMATAASVMLALGIFFILFPGWKMAKKMQTTAALRTDGRDAVGEITRLWEEREKYSNLHVGYTFTINGASYTGESDVPYQLWQSIRQASSLPIRYLPANPAMNHPAEWEGPNFSGMWLLGSASFILPFLISVAFFTILLSERKLVGKGLLAAAVVKNCSSGRRGFSVMYEFRTQDENVITGRGWSPCRHEIGTSVWVLYLPQNPRRNQPYPLLTYRVAE